MSKVFLLPPLNQPALLRSQMVKKGVKGTARGVCGRASVHVLFFFILQKQK